MQAQASGSPLDAITQNKAAMIGIFAVAGIAVIIGIVAGVRSMSGSAMPPAQVAGADPGMSTDAAGSMPGTTNPTDIQGGAPPAMTPPPAAGGFPAAGAPSMGGFPGAAPAAGQTPPTQARSAGVPVRRNPFLPNSDLEEVIRSVPEIKKPEFLSDAHSLYQELYTPKQEVAVSDDENEGPPVPAMRVTGIVLGTQVSALMQIGGEFFSVVPGQAIPNKDNPIYRVEQIEAGKVILTRKWEQGNRKGVQRIEVPISQAAGGGQRGGMGAPGFGAPGGFGSGGRLPGGAPGTGI